MKLLWKLLITGASLWVAIWLVPGLDFEGDAWLYLGVTVLVVLANIIVKPIIKLFSLPLIAFTLGLFLLVINAAVLQLVVWLSEDVFELGLTSDAFFWSTFLGAAIISVVTMILNKVLPD